MWAAQTLSAAIKFVITKLLHKCLVRGERFVILPAVR